MNDITESDEFANETASTNTVLDVDPDALSYAIVTAVADAEDTDALDLPPLHESIDVDAVDALVSDGRRRRTEGMVTFTFAGYDVTVDFDGRLELAPKGSDDGTVDA